MNKSILRFSIGAALVSGMFGCAVEPTNSINHFREQLEKARLDLIEVGRLVVKIDKGPIVNCACAVIEKPNGGWSVPTPPPPMDDAKALEVGKAAIEELNVATLAGTRLNIVAADAAPSP